MKRHKSKTMFWIALATANIFALIYPLSLVRAARNVDQNFFATCVLIGVMFALTVIDAVSLVIVNADTAEERRAFVAHLLITSLRGAGIQLPDMSRNGNVDPLYLFARRLEWRNERDLEAYDELVSALYDSNSDTRAVAEFLLGQSSLAVMPAEASSSQKLSGYGVYQR